MHTLNSGIVIPDASAKCYPIVLADPELKSALEKTMVHDVAELFPYIFRDDESVPWSEYGPRVEADEGNPITARAAIYPLRHVYVFVEIVSCAADPELSRSLAAYGAFHRAVIFTTYGQAVRFAERRYDPAQCPRVQLRRIFENLSSDSNDGPWYSQLDFQDLDGVCLPASWRTDDIAPAAPSLITATTRSYPLIPLAPKYQQWTISRLLSATPRANFPDVFRADVAHPPRTVASEGMEEAYGFRAKATIYVWTNLFLYVEVLGGSCEACDVFQPRYFTEERFAQHILRRLLVFRQQEDAIEFMRRRMRNLDKKLPSIHYYLEEMNPAWKANYIYLRKEFEGLEPFLLDTAK